jgi:hypothetical protein
VKKGILRALGVVVTLALMLAALPASVASAAVTSVSITPGYSGEIGDKVKVRVLADDNGEIINIYFSSQNVSSQNVVQGKLIDTDVTTYKLMASPMVNSKVAYTSDGVQIPDKLTDGADDLTALHGGKYYFYFTLGENSKEIVYKVDFYLEGLAGIEPSITSGVVGSQVEITGLGYAKGENLTVRFDDVDITNNIVTGDGAADINGSFLMTVAIPENLKGAHNVSVIGLTSLAVDTFEFTIVPSISLNVNSSAPGTDVVISGYGFDRLQYFDVYITGDNGTVKLDDNNAPVRGDRANTLGSFSYTATIPSTLAPGNYTISVEGEEDDSVYVTKNFQITLNSVLTISNNTGNVGDTVTVNGTCYAAGSTVTIYYDDVSVGTATVNSSGAFTKEITIPESTCGAHIIKVGTIEEIFTVEAVMTIDITEGIAGTEVTIEGTGFQGDTDISLEFDGDDVDIEDGDEVTDANGSFSLSFIVPSLAPGSYDIDITAGPEKSAEFEIPDATIELGATEGEVGDTITVTGANFAAGSTITFAIDGEAVATLPTPVTAGTDGSFAASFDIPTIAGGAHTLTVSDGATSKTAEFTVNATATMTPTLGNVGTQVTISGEGFIANHNITITYNGTALQSDTPVTTDEDGVFTATFTVPASPGGERTVTVSDDTNSVQFTFNMEETAPPAPTLTAPESASKQKGIVTFEWTPVTDSSMPVTYTLQVATDSAFTNKVVEHGLSETTYTLTEAEKLTKLPDGGQYYWRVIATDAASNTSESAAGTFVVGGGLPGWLMWLWIGIGVVVVFIFAIWLGRRLAYSSY